LIIVDLVRGVRPPFDPFDTTKGFVALCREYRIDEIHGDKYAAEWVSRAFEDAGLSYMPAEKNKSDIYLEALPLFTRASIRIPDHAPLLRELRLLERRTHKGGRDVVDHGRNGSDDLANALCGAAVLAQSPVFSYTAGWVSGPYKKDDLKERKEREERVKALIELLKRGERIPF
jgi:hypothetical protein